MVQEDPEQPKSVRRLATPDYHAFERYGDAGIAIHQGRQSRAVGEGILSREITHALAFDQDCDRVGIMGIVRFRPKDRVYREAYTFLAKAPRDSPQGVLVGRLSNYLEGVVAAENNRGEPTRVTSSQESIKKSHLLATYLKYSTDLVLSAPMGLLLFHLHEPDVRGALVRLWSEEWEEIADRPDRGECYGKALTNEGWDAYGDAMPEALREYNDEWLYRALDYPGYWLTSLPRRGRGGRGWTTYRGNRAEHLRRLCYGEFNVAYIRGLARALRDRGETHAVVYRAGDAAEPRTECTGWEGDHVPLDQVIAGHRARYWPPPATEQLGCCRRGSAATTAPTPSASGSHSAATEPPPSACLSTRATRRVSRALPTISLWPPPCRQPRWIEYGCGSTAAENK